MIFIPCFRSLRQCCQVREYSDAKLKVWQKMLASQTFSLGLRIGHSPPDPAALALGTGTESKHIFNGESV